MIEERILCKVTVGVCVKNSRKTIGKTVDSIVDQDFPNGDVEIIVVDGNSEDGTVDVIAARTSRTPAVQVKMCNDGGKGLGVARQMVVDNAYGKYIVWIDGDVAVPKDFIRKQVEFMEKNPKVGVAVAKFSYKEEGSLIATLQNMYNYTEDSFIGNDATIYRVKPLKQVGGFDEHIKGAEEDTDIQIRMKEKGWAITVNKETEFYHNRRETLKDLWDEHFWYGYGGHYINHKHRGIFKFIRHRIPVLYFFLGVQRSLKAYKMAWQKKSFLLPLLCFFEGTAWLLGFTKAHIDGYGHRLTPRRQLRIARFP